MSGEIDFTFTDARRRLLEEIELGHRVVMALFMENRAALLDLYDIEREAYYAYVRIERGDDLGPAGQVSPRRVAEARDKWHAALRVLVNAGGTANVMTRLLRERVKGEGAP
jgi:uncharacterized protein YecA (UPF0149 family)